MNPSLIEPTSSDWGVCQELIGPLRADAVHGCLAAMSGAVVHVPEDAPRSFTGFLAHDLVNQAIDSGQRRFLPRHRPNTLAPCASRAARQLQEPLERT
jgi:hypothetical protein